MKYLYKLSDLAWEKVILVVSPFLLSIFLPAGKYVAMAAFFVLSDFITGILAARKRGEPIRSRRMADTVTKFIAYGVFIYVASALEHGIPVDFPCVKLTAMFVVYLELKSIDENAKDITGHSIFSKIIQLINPKRK